MHQILKMNSTSDYYSSCTRGSCIGSMISDKSVVVVLSVICTFCSMVYACAYSCCPCSQSSKHFLCVVSILLFTVAQFVTVHAQPTYSFLNIPLGQVGKRRQRFLALLPIELSSQSISLLKEFIDAESVSLPPTSTGYYASPQRKIIYGENRVIWGTVTEEYIGPEARRVEMFEGHNHKSRHVDNGEVEPWWEYCTHTLDQARTWVGIWT